MATYRKKGEIVHAYQLNPDSVASISVWCGGKQVEEIDALDPNKKFVALNIPTLEGVIRASEGDYIIRDSQGHFTRCSEDAFSRIYDSV